MNSRNPKIEARELGKLKNPAIVCVWRHYDEPIPKWRKVLNKWRDRIGRPAQWKADLHAFSLSLLPTVVAFYAALAASGASGVTFWIIMVLYAIMVITVVFFKGFSKEVVDDKAERNKVVFSLIFLVVVAFLLAVVRKVLETLSGDPVIQGWVALIAAAVTAIFSQKPLALDPEYLVEAKESPPLFSDREKTVWKKQQQSTES